MQSKLTSAQYFSYPSLTRYFDHIQSCPPVRKAADSLSVYPLVPFDLNNAPALERTAEPPKKKEKAKQAEPAQAEDAKTQKKEKKEAAPKGDAKKKVASGGAAKAAVADDSGEPVPSMIDLRVGHIVDSKHRCYFNATVLIFLQVMKHPDADGLYVEVR